VGGPTGERRVGAPDPARDAGGGAPKRFVHRAVKRAAMLLLAALALAKPSTPVTFVGLDYSLAKFVGSGDFQDVGQVTTYYPGEWNRLWADEMMEKLAYAAGPVTQDISIVAANNAKVTEAQIVRQDGGDSLVTQSDITPEALGALVKSYDLKGATGLGLVLVVDRYVKLQEKGCTWVVFFDAQSRAIRAKERVCEDAAGFGFRNYWFRTEKDLMDDIERLKPRG
jgi:hypothetical protein